MGSLGGFLASKILILQLGLGNLIGGQAILTGHLSADLDA